MITNALLILLITFDMTNLFPETGQYAANSVQVIIKVNMARRTDLKYGMYCSSLFYNVENDQNKKKAKKEQMCSN